MYKTVRGLGILLAMLVPYGCSDDGAPHLGPFHSREITATDSAVCIRHDGVTECVGRLDGVAPDVAEATSVPLSAEGVAWGDMLCWRDGGDVLCRGGRHYAYYVTTDASDVLGVYPAFLNDSVLDGVLVVRDASWIKVAGAVQTEDGSPEAYFCAKESAGDVVCWSDAIGQWLVDAPFEVQDVCFTKDLACVVLTTGTVMCSNQQDAPHEALGPDGLGGEQGQWFTIPVATEATKVECTNEYACVLDVEGTLWCWGVMDSLGRGASATPVELASSVRDFTTLVGDGLIWVHDNGAVGTMGQEGGGTTGSSELGAVAVVPHVACVVSGDGDLVCLQDDGRTTVVASGVDRAAISPYEQPLSYCAHKDDGWTCTGRNTRYALGLDGWDAHYLRMSRVLDSEAFVAVPAVFHDDGSVTTVDGTDLITLDGTPIKVIPNASAYVRVLLEDGRLLRVAPLVYEIRPLMDGVADAGAGMMVLTRDGRLRSIYGATLARRGAVAVEGDCALFDDQTVRCGTSLEVAAEGWSILGRTAPVGICRVAGIGVVCGMRGTVLSCFGYAGGQCDEHLGPYDVTDLGYVPDSVAAAPFIDAIVVTHDGEVSVLYYRISDIAYKLLEVCKTKLDSRAGAK